MSGAFVVAALGALRAAVVPDQPPDPAGTRVIAPGIALRRDPAGSGQSRWASPRGRLLEIATEVETPGDWLGLHIDLPGFDARAPAWIGFAAATGADHALVLRACLRSGLATGGFRDEFFDRHLLSQPARSDHVDLIAPATRPDLPARAPWRELILFLPPERSFAWVLHDLRLFLL